MGIKIYYILSVMLIHAYPLRVKMGSVDYLKVTITPTALQGKNIIEFLLVGYIFVDVGVPI